MPLSKKAKLTERQKALRAEKRLKKRLEAQADALWHLAIIKKWGNICFFHNSGKEAKEHQKYVKFGHHIKPKGLYSNLRYDLDNGLPACWPCHYKMEKVDRSMSGDVIVRRGKRWYNRLEKKSQEKLKPSYQSVAYYTKVVENLSN